ncbi:MAG: hypothetical protein KDJ16_03135, partial [Hyphomicrobiales bacterium]|nr:hypothetical protein [Hyphomicrobiales bacterium]
VAKKLPYCRHSYPPQTRPVDVSRIIDAALFNAGLNANNSTIERSLPKWPDELVLNRAFIRGCGHGRSGPN